MTVNQLFAEFRELANNTREKGYFFERFIKQYLLTDPVYKNRFEKLWLWSDFDYAKSRSDVGIDIVAQEKGTNEFCAIQCKFYSPEHSIQKEHIDSFISATGNSFNVDGVETHFSSSIIVSSTDKWGVNAESAIKDQKIPITRIDLADFLNNTSVDWSEFSLKKPETIQYLQKKKKLRPHQEEALASVISGFNESDRGKLIMACGTGKTFASLKIAETIVGAGGSVLFLAPSISLLSQTIREWLLETDVAIGCVPVCSDAKVSKDAKKIANDDTGDISVSDLIFPASTNVGKFIERYNSFDNSVMKVVFSTYQSIDVIHKAQEKSEFTFDLIICDEAHRTTGVTLSGADESAFIKVHDNSFISSAKRLYMTATPRVYGEKTKRKAKDFDAVLCSMDDETLYGKEFYQLGFGKAVENDLLSDYKVLILTVSETYINIKFQEQLADESNELNLEDAAKIMGCWNGLSKRSVEQLQSVFNVDVSPMKRAVAFSNSIANSKSVMTNFQAMQKDKNDDDLVNIEIDHVDGTMNSLVRNKKLYWLKSEIPDGECRILTNARCLSEGVDVPSLDAVLFLSPRNSIVDVVQSVGRVMRRSEGKKYGYIILPIAISLGVPPEEALSDNKRYKVVWDVLQALRSHDDRFNHEINTIEFNKKSSSEGRKINVIGITGDSSKNTEITIHELSLETDYIELDTYKDAIFTRIVNKCGDRSYWAGWATDIAKIATQHTHQLNSMLEDENSSQSHAFYEFLESLRANINENISKDGALEMLSQHLITKPVFETLFEGYSFVNNNPVSLSMQKMLDNLNSSVFEKEIKSLSSFYESVKNRAKGIDDAEGKQKIIIMLYNEFFKLAIPKAAVKLGIVYTPVEVVDFIIRSVQSILKERFGRNIGDAGVQIIDPFTGTGTFIVRLLQSGFISKEQLLQKYMHEIHANEIVLLAYYIAAINIENVFHDLMEGGDYKTFDGIVLTDTFALMEDRDTRHSQSIFEENNSRLQKQKDSKIKIIIGNPPYSVGQKSANDNNANVKYPALDKAIANTYAKASIMTNKTSLYDSYIKAFRWSSDRLQDEGIICFITNGGFIDGLAADGFRKCLVKEFSEIYCLNLHGAIDGKTGDAAKREGQNIFNIKIGVAITLLVKIKGHKGNAKLFYSDIGDYLNRREKLQKLSISDITNIKWQAIEPNKEGDWINKRNQDFVKNIPLGDKKDKYAQTVFKTHSRGIGTYRDTWCYNFSKEELAKNIENMINFYNSQLEAYKQAKDKQSKYIEVTDIKVKDFVDNDKTKISWSADLRKNLKKKKNIKFDKKNIRLATYRPFCKRYLYYSKELNDRQGRIPSIFPTEHHKNIVIGVHGKGGKKDFSTLIADITPDLEYVAKSQCFPLYEYTDKYIHENIDEYGYSREYALTDYVWLEYKNRYGAEITKENIFYYIYGVLHSPDYRTQFAKDLKKVLPHLPFVKTAEDFWMFSKAGVSLANLHLNYETLTPYPVTIKETSTKINYKITKMKFVKNGKDNDKTKIIYNDTITLEDIPIKTYEYIVNGRSAIEWVMDQYCIDINKESLLINDGNKYNENEQYVIHLLKCLVTLSLETLKIVEQLPKLEIENK